MGWNPPYVRGWCVCCWYELEAALDRGLLYVRTYTGATSQQLHTFAPDPGPYVPYDLKDILFATFRDATVTFPRRPLSPLLQRWRAHRGMIRVHLDLFRTLGHAPELSDQRYYSPFLPLAYRSSELPVMTALDDLT